MYGNVHIPPKGTTLADVTIVVLGGRTRRSCVLAAAFLALFAASGARAVDPELRDAMKASVPAVPQKHAKRVESRTTDRDRAQADGERVVPRRLLAALHFTFRPPDVLVPLARGAGLDALGTGSLPRSARWKALGGHGRYGPG